MPPVFVINMARSIERWDAIRSVLMDQLIEPVRIEAVDGSRLCQQMRDLMCDPAQYRSCHGRDPMPAEIGCYVSHLRALRRFVQSPHAYAVVLEDDASISEDFREIIESLASSDLGGFDVVKLQGRHHGLSIPTTAVGGIRLHVNLTRVTGATGYMLNRVAAERYLHSLSKMVVPFDHAFDRPLQLGLRIASALPYPVSPSGASSTIAFDGSQRLKGWEKLPALAWRTGTEIGRVLAAVGACARVWKRKSPARGFAAAGL